MSYNLRQTMFLHKFFSVLISNCLFLFVVTFGHNDILFLHELHSRVEQDQTSVSPDSYTFQVFNFILLKSLYRMYTYLQIFFLQKVYIECINIYKYFIHK